VKLLVLCNSVTVMSQQVCYKVLYVLTACCGLCSILLLVRIWYLLCEINSCNFSVKLTFRIHAWLKNDFELSVWGCQEYI